MDVENNVGAARVQDFVAVLKGRAAKLIDRKIVLVDSRPHGAVHDDDPLIEQFMEQFCSISPVSHRESRGKGQASAKKQSLITACVE